MPSVEYRTVDVFTERRFGGNPLAVVPDARGLSDDTMQRVAAEFNYSETTFVLPPSDPANSARVRIFTPTDEIPFAGHPNVGTAYVLGKLGAVLGQPVTDTLRFEEQAGLVEAVLVREGGATPRAGEVVGAEFTTPRGLEIGARVEVGTVAACASLPPASVTTANHEPVVVSVGLPFVVAELTDLAALAEASPDTARFAEAHAHHPLGAARFSLFLYTRLPGQPAGVRPNRLRARMFAPLSNIPEDPATGSASAALGAYLVSLYADADPAGVLEIEQGVEMGRPSLIALRVETRAGAVTSVVVAGRCVEVMRGVLEL